MGWMYIAQVAKLEGKPCVERIQCELYSIIIIYIPLY